MAVSAFKKDGDGYYETVDIGDDLDWGHDLTEQLIEDGNDTIASSAWTVPSGVTSGDEGYTALGKTSIFLKCTEAGAFELANTVVTTNGRTYVMKFRLIAS